MSKETIEEISPRALTPNSCNARTHSKKQIRQIAESIRSFGFASPVLIDETGMILAGHGRIEAAKLLKMNTVPCRQISKLSPAKKRALTLADNKIALNAGWDEDILSAELQELIKADIDFEVRATGFEPGEIDFLIEAPSPSEPNVPEDELLPALDETAVTKPGQLWLLGEHNLYCGNSLEANSYEQALGPEKAQMVFSDAPYNVRIDGNVCGSGKIRHREFAMATGEMNSREFTDFLTDVFQLCARWSTDGSIHFQCMDWRHLVEIRKAGDAAYNELKNVCVWVKDNAGMGSFYRSRHEFVFVFKNGSAPHINNFGLGDTGRYRTNVWSYRGVNSGGANRLEELTLHPTVKPVAMIADAIRDCSQRSSVILDPFGGSGSTLIAAERTKRRACLIEIDPVYVDRTIRRWQRVAGDDATDSVTGKTFDEFEAKARSVIRSGLGPRQKPFNDESKNTAKKVKPPSARQFGLFDESCS